MGEKVYIVGATRTAFGKFLGSLKDIEVETLASIVIKKAIEKSNINPEEVDLVHLGNSNTSESKDVVAPVIARQALLKAGLPPTVLSSTVDKACCSGTEAIKRGFDAIKLGEADVTVVGGVQSMSRTPHIITGLRTGQKLGNFTLEDRLYPTGYKEYNPVAVDAGEVAVEYGVGREEQDEWALLSQQRYQTAESEGKLKEEITSIEIERKREEPFSFVRDEFPKPHTTLEKLKKLPTIFGNPTVTAGNSPGLNDGASAMVLVSEEKLNKLGLEPLAEVVTAASVADQPKNIAVTPALAMKKALAKTGLSLDDIHLLEINEAFAAVPLVSSKILGEFDDEKTKKVRDRLNVNGGSIAVGHPLGATGARIVMTLMNELNRRGGGYGVAAICGGLAQGDAILIKV